MARLRLPVRGEDVGDVVKVGRHTAVGLVGAVAEIRSGRKEQLRLCHRLTRMKCFESLMILRRLALL